MPSTKEKIVSLLSYIDIFSITPSSRFTFKNEKKYSTIVGRFFSLIIYILMLLAFYYFSRNLIYKTTSNTLTSDLLIPNPEAYPLNKDSFFFAFGLQNSSNNFLSFIDNSIYSIKATLRTKQGSNFTVQELELGECDPADFPSNSDLKSYFKTNDMKGYYCIKNFTNLEMIGYWDSPLYKDINFFVRPCRNGTSESVCKSQREIDQIFDDGYFGSFLMTGVVDPSNYEKPLTYTPMNYYTRVSLKTYVFVELSFQHIDVETDSGFFFEDKNSVHGIGKSMERQSVTVEPKDVVFELLMRLDRIKKQYQRRYDKIQDVMANTGGIFQFLSFFTMIILAKFVELSFLVEMSKEVFELENIENKCRNRSLSVSSIRQKSIKTPNNVFFESSNLKKIDKNENISFKIRRFFFFSFKFFQESIKLYEKADEQFTSKMDINNLIKKLSEIDKLKFLLFDKYQLYVFDLIPKPKIFLYKESKKSMSKSFINYNNILMTKKFSINSRKTDDKSPSKAEKKNKAINSVISKNHKTDFDLRLIELLKLQDVISYTSNLLPMN